jgi:hypothetical protein
LLFELDELGRRRGRLEAVEDEVAELDEEVGGSTRIAVFLPGVDV